MFFEYRGYLKRLPKYGRREQNALWRFGSYLLSVLSYNAKSMAGAILEGHLWSDSYVFFFSCFLDVSFLHFLGIRGIHINPIFGRKYASFWSLPGALWEPSGHLWETFGDQGGPKAPKSVPKATQRLQGSPKGVRKDDMTRLSQ